MIPKIAHFYWGGGNLSFLRYLTIWSFHKFNPDWEIRFHFPKESSRSITWETHEHKYSYDGQDYFEKLAEIPMHRNEVDYEAFGMDPATPEAQKGDLIKWWLLGTEGGLWLDMDIVFFGAVRFPKRVDTCVSINALYGHSIGFLASSPRNSYFAYLFQKAQKSYCARDYQSMGSSMINPEFPTVPSIRKRFPGLRVFNIPMGWVYPYHAGQIEQIFTSGACTFHRSTIGLHWYAGHPQAANSVNHLTEKTYRDSMSPIGMAVRRSIEDCPRRGRNSWMLKMRRFLAGC